MYYIFRQFIGKPEGGGVVEAKNANADGARVLRKILALPLLPSARIREAYDTIRNEARNYGNIFTVLLAYVWSTWIVSYSRGVQRLS